MGYWWAMGSRWVVAESLSHFGHPWWVCGVWASLWGCRGILERQAKGSEPTGVGIQTTAAEVTDSLCFRRAAALAGLGFGVAGIKKPVTTGIGHQFMQFLENQCRPWRWKSGGNRYTRLHRNCKKYRCSHRVGAQKG